MSNELNEYVRQLEVAKEEEKRVIVENEVYKHVLEAVRYKLQ